MVRKTIIGLGSLLSEKSSRRTFPDLTGFRLGRVRGYRRVFAHPAGVFFTNGIADLEKGRICSLSAEKCPDGSFLCTLFEVDMDEAAWDRYKEREEEFDVQPVPFESLTGEETGEGLLCCRWTDEEYIAARGQDQFDRLYKAHGLTTIWGYPESAQIFPCSVYLRHCTLAARNLGEEAEKSFLEDTFLIDRTTTVGQYLEANPWIMDTEPPAALAERYGG
eukprot:TRINITY_DN111698_c0_g1_i1.p1 TRINITY_DN111698_c0_g1~~TRINITY_DN111698_c0_g1_i1.p1  ORF type:complete len:235 (-),score=33.38 TRINITY_DN111698_c0_g1_i1:269-928(-)